MRVALLAQRAPAHNAVGNYLASELAFFLERGADARVFLEELRGVHPAIEPHAHVVDQVESHGPVWEFLSTCDLVFAQYPHYYRLLDYLPLLVGKKPRVVFDYHGVTPPAGWPSAQREILELGQVRRGLAWCADAVITQSRWMRDDLAAATTLPREWITVTPLPIPSPRTNEVSPGGNRTDKTQILFVGRLAVNKRVPLIVESIARLRDRQPEVHALLAGDAGDAYAEEARKIRELAQALGVSERIHFLGEIDDDELAKTYRSASVLVLPSVHEGLGIPLIEAMAAGVPVLAARAAALPETVSDAGLTFKPDDVEDLVRQLDRILPSPRTSNASPGGSEPLRLAIVSFRFGPDIVGGAETSLATIARALHESGHHVEVFTTCTKSESNWTNETPAGTFELDGLAVHRFPIDIHDRAAHLRTLQPLSREPTASATPAEEDAYLRHGLHSSALVNALLARRDELDAIVVGPYLFGLTHDVARALPEKTLLLPCFHDEPLAHLRAWQSAYTAVGGILYHTPEEQDFAEVNLGLNHPRAHQIGTWLSCPPRGPVFSPPYEGGAGGVSEGRGPNFPPYPPL